MGNLPHADARQGYHERVTSTSAMLDLPLSPMPTVITRLMEGAGLLFCAVAFILFLRQAWRLFRESQHRGAKGLRARAVLAAATYAVIGGVFGWAFAINILAPDPTRVVLKPDALEVEYPYGWRPRVVPLAQLSAATYRESSAGLGLSNRSRRPGIILGMKSGRDAVLTSRLGGPENLTRWRTAASAIDQWAREQQER